MYERISFNRLRITFYKWCLSIGQTTGATHNVGDYALERVYRRSTRTASTTYWHIVRITGQYPVELPFGHQQMNTREMYEALTLATQCITKFKGLISEE